MAGDGRTEAPDPGADNAAEPKEAEHNADDTEGDDTEGDDTEGDDPEGDDTEGQALTWKVRKPIGEAAEVAGRRVSSEATEDDTEGQA